MASKRLAIPKGTPFMPLSSAKLIRRRFEGDQALERFNALQETANGVPETYKRQSPYNLQEMVERFEKLYSQYPVASPEIVEAHRRLGYPAHYIKALETGEYKAMLKPPLKEDGTEDMDALQDFWSFDNVASANFRLQHHWDRLAKNVGAAAKAGEGIRVAPTVDWKQAYSNYRLQPQLASQLRNIVEQQLADELILSSDGVTSAFGRYQQPADDRLADALYNLYKEKEGEVAYYRRAALVQWLEARGDIIPQDIDDMMPKQRDQEALRQDELGLFMYRVMTPNAEETERQEIPSWANFRDMLAAQQKQWLAEDEHAELGGQQTAAALLQKRIEGIVRREDTTQAAKSGAAGGEKAARQTVMTADDYSRQLQSKVLEKKPEKVPYVVEGLIRSITKDDPQDAWGKATTALKQKLTTE